jgi:outer membrane protein TolC
VAADDKTAAPAPQPSASEMADNGQPRIADQGTGTGTTSTNSSPTVAAPITNTSKNNYGGRFYLSQFIDAFGLLSAEKTAEKLTTDFYAIDVDRSENEVALSAKNLYFNVILAEQDVATDQEAVNDATESVRVTNALVQQGQAAGFDLLSAQTTLANDQQLLETANVNYNDAISELDYLLGLNPGTPVTLTVPPLPPLNQQVNLQQSTLVALQRRPEIMQANQNVSLAQKLVRIAGAGTTPTVGLVGEYGYNSESSVSSPTNEGLVSAQISLPIEDGGATRSRVREAKVVEQSQVTTKNELQLNVQLEVRQAYLNILEGQSSVSTSQTAVALAVETLRVANVQYQNGVGTILDVENAQAQLATARTNLSNAQFTYETALAALVRDIGSR